METKKEKKTNIFIIDDKPKNIQVAVNILQEDNYKFFVSTSGKNVVSKIRDIDVDLILLDVMMPGINGYEVFMDLQKDQKTNDIPIIFLTAVTDSESVIRAFDLGAVDYITKPFHPKELKARVKTHLKLRQTLKELKEKNVLLEVLSTKDALTNLYNRRFIEDSLKRDFFKSQRYKTPLSCIMIDIDNFKFINDTYGHQIGDMVLKDIGKLLLTSSRKTDLCGRYGGEEFLIIVQQELENAAQFAEKLVKIIRNYSFVYKDINLNITVSIGIASFNEEIKDQDELVKFADDALYNAKKQGKDRFEKHNRLEYEDFKI
ncbi:MAG: diguanylate cyclase [Leptospiraceae bacterium]|nr:diguanylate cyclase [Leptospiraceae bacterium]MCP5493851.1 diguanylate cyclase [Leptospiraceae bacterium]